MRRFPPNNCRAFILNAQFSFRFNGVFHLDGRRNLNGLLAIFHLIKITVWVMNEGLTENSLSSNTVCCNWGNGPAERITHESVCLSFHVCCMGSRRNVYNKTVAGESYLAYVKVTRTKNALELFVRMSPFKSQFFMIKCFCVICFVRRGDSTSNYRYLPSFVQIILK